MLAIEYAFGDFIPLIALSTLLLPQLIRTLSNRCQDTEVVVCCIPLGTIICAIAAKSVIAGPGIALELIWRPAVISGTTGLLVLWLGARHKRPYLSYTSIAYGLAFLLTIGYSPDKSHELNWRLFGAGLVLILLFLGVLKENIALCLTAVFVTAGGLALTDTLARFADACDMTTWSVFTGIIGLGVIAVSLGFGRKTQKAVSVFGAACLAISLLDYLGWSLSPRDIAVAAGTFAISATLWLRTRHVFAITVLFAPVAVKSYILVREIPSWGYVFLSFVLLFLGALVSLFCKHPRQQDDTGNRNATNQPQ